MLTLWDCWEMFKKHSCPRSGEIPFFALTCVNWLIEGNLQTLRDAYMDFLDTLSGSAIEVLNIVHTFPILDSHPSSCWKTSLKEFKTVRRQLGHTQSSRLFYPSENMVPILNTRMIDLCLLFLTCGPEKSLSFWIKVKQSTSIYIYLDRTKDKYFDKFLHKVCSI